MNLPFELKKKYLIENCLLFSFMTCALFQCINVSIANALQIFVYLFFILYFLKNKDTVLRRFQTFKIFFFIYFLYALFELLPVFGSPEVGIAFKIWSRTYFLRGLLFLILLLSFDNKKAYSFILLSLLASFTIDSLACLILDTDVKYGGRVTGFFGHPMVYAGLSCIVLPFFIYKVLNEKILMKRMGFLFFLAGFLALLLLNGTRGAWIAVAVVFLIILFLSKLSLKALFALTIVCTVLGFSSIYSSQEVANRISSITSPEVYLKSERLFLWNSSYKMFKDHPILGVGLGEYGKRYQKEYINENAKERNLTRAHSNIFQLLGESGLSGLAGYLLLISFLLVKSFRNYLSTKEGMYLVIFSSTLCLFLQGLTEYNLGHSAVMKFYWLWLGALFPLALCVRKNNEDSCCL